MLARAACLCLFSTLGVGGLCAKEPRQIRESDAAFVGSIGCKSSSCHGGAGAKRNQYTIWSREDFHTKAYAVLLNARSERIAENLGIDAAQSSARCTSCHSPFQSVAPTRLTQSARPDEGVSCENCHGAAGGWLRGHTRSDWTYNTRVAAGMRDLRNLYVRANACVACHQNLPSEVLKAGHPDLFFELDSQSVAEPKHWHDEQPWSGLREWLTGQAVALREMSWAGASNSQNDAFLVARWDGLAWICAAATAWGNVPSPISLPKSNPDQQEFTRMQSESDALARRASTFTWSEDSVRHLVGALAALHPEFLQKGRPIDVVAQRAKRLVLALDRLTTGLNQNCGMCLKIEPEINQLFQDVRTLDAFDPVGFADHLRNFRMALEKAK